MKYVKMVNIYLKEIVMTKKTSKNNKAQGFTRSSGILLHPTSLPSQYGMGDLGKNAYEFVDFLKESNQKLWQVLPLGPTGFGDSPYQSFSSFAGNHYLISPDELKKQGFLSDEDLSDIPDFDPRSIDYGPVIIYKMRLLIKAFENFKLKATPAQKSKLTKFSKENKKWLDDYALFVAIKAHFINERKNEYESEGLKTFAEDNKEFLTDDQIKDYYYGAVWGSWPEGLKNRDKIALKEMETKLSNEIDFCKFLQYEFFREWVLLKEYANEADIKIIGDIPIFVAGDSSDVWAHRELYQLDKDGNPTAVAGCPPDYFAETGQLWGNPLYNWEEHKKTDYAWWASRFEAVLSMVDIVRIDHFRGFETYWATPYGEKTAENGKWIKGPAKSFFNSIKKQLGSLPIIAEDLGEITDKVRELRDSLSLPGMRILHFAYGSDNENLYLPHSYETNLTVVYTGTHDNNTTVGWYEEATEKEKDYLRRYLNINGNDIAWDLIRQAFSTNAVYAIVPLQDIMSLGTNDRMNTPGIASGWWKFRYTSDMLKPEYNERLTYLTELFNR